MVLLNTAWGKSFERTDKNKIAISSRGWNPLNRALLCVQEIIGTMTEEDKRLEEEVPYKMKMGVVGHNKTIPTFNAAYLPANK